MKINETPEMIEHRVVDSAPWHKEFPVSGGDYVNAVDDPIAKDYHDKSIRDYAIARFAAIYLAGGKGLINDKADRDEWGGSRVHKNEVERTRSSGSRRARSFLRLSMASPLMGEGPDVIMRVFRRLVSRGAALHYSEITARDFENIGESLFLSGCFPIFLGEPKMVSDASENVAASAKGRRDMSDLWLIDTGCGHDLIPNTNVKLSNVESKRLERAVIFQTANGDTPSTHAAPTFFSELSETIEPYILKETPSVISVGGRTMNRGCSFMWKAGCNPYLITPEEKAITFEVIRDTPYLRKNSGFCQPRGATEEDYRTQALPSIEGVAADDNVDGAQPSEGGGEDPRPVQVLIEDVSDELGELNPRRNLREEATSMIHLLSHKPFYIHCDACNLGKMRRAKKFAGSLQASRQPTGWLDLVAADHLVAKNGSTYVWKVSPETLMPLWSRISSRR